MIEDLKKVLAAAKAVAEESSASQIANAEGSESLAKSQELVALAKEMPELKDRLLRSPTRPKFKLSRLPLTRRRRLKR